MQFLDVISIFALLVIGSRCESDSLIEGQQDFLHTFHHGQQHGHVGAGSDVGSSGQNLAIPTGAAGHLLPSPHLQDQGVVPQEQVSSGHNVVGQIGQGSGGLGGGPFIGGPVVPSYGGHKSDVQLHLGGARAFSNYIPYAARAYSAPVYQQPSNVPFYYGGYNHIYPHLYQPTVYSAAPYSSPHVPASVYFGYPGYNYQFGQHYIPGGYPVAYQSGNEVQPVVSKQ